MPDAHLDLLTTNARTGWVRLRTLINLRWLAIIGQTGSVLVATTWLDLTMDIGLCFVAIGASIVFNIISTLIYPRNKRLSEHETLLALLFDLSQLVFLLYLTGGLNNPFALLALAPVTIAATSLSLRSTVILGAVAVLLITMLAWFYEPLRTNHGDILKMPDIFITGFWIALIIGLVFLAFYARRVTTETESMSQALIATQMALSREQKLTDLGGVVAAAAHELGTPLATIKLVSSELLDELDECPSLRDDIELIRQQADRCRDILRDMGRTGKDDMLTHHAPISSVVREAVEPHEGRGKKIHFSFTPKTLAAGEQPSVQRKPEIIHGLRNLVQNAVDFATENVWVDVIWSENTVRIVIADDGRGYPPELIGRIGDPFVHKRRPRHPDPHRPEYEGMGLGLFIAKTLLERSGAEITFANGSDPFLSAEETPRRRGAIVEVIWPRKAIEQDAALVHGPLGKNAPLEV